MTDGVPQLDGAHREAKLVNMPLRVTVSVAGVFHAFQLALALQDHEMLERLITSYPRSRTLARTRGRLRPELVSSSNLYAVQAALSRAGIRDSLWSRPLRRAHDAFAAVTMPTTTTVAVGWSGCSGRYLETARKRGIRSVVVRGSSHILAQRALLAEEHASLGLPFTFSEQSVADEVREYALADYVQTNSSFALRTFLAHGVPRERLLMTPTGIDVEAFQPRPRDDEVFRVAYAGALSARKGVHYLLQAWHELALPGAELWMLGSHQPELMPIVSKYLSPSVRLFGHVPEGQLAQYYTQCSAFVMPSIEEGLAIVQTQAMACGLPLICTTNTGGEDLLSGPGVEGFVVPIRDVDALKEKLLWLHDNPDERAEMGRAAHARALSHLRTEDYAARIVDIYRRTFGEARETREP